MRILFFMPGPGYLRHYASTLRLLAGRGHRVHLAFDGNEPDVDTGQALLDDLAREFPGITWGAVVTPEPSVWPTLSRAVRLFLDYLRYFDPAYEKATILRDRMHGKTPENLLRAFDFVVKSCRVPPALLRPVLRALDYAVPVEPALLDWIRTRESDLILVTPLVYFGSGQVDYVKAARRLGITSALCVASWDNLTNKGLIRLSPDRVFVWNEHQRTEAAELHGIPPERVTTTGAQTFDDWFVYRPARAREEFLRTVGLPADRPFLLYLCSSKSIAPNEVVFIEKWVKALRSSGSETLRRAGVLVRPHPKNLEQWAYPDVLRHDGVVVWPRDIHDWVIDDESKSAYFDTLYHCAAVVGINTSALIEAAIVGRAVYSVLAPEFVRTQQGTLHFRYLEGGLLRVAQGFDQHLRQLDDVLSGRTDDRERCRAFTEGFVRPHGLDTPAAQRLAAGIESLGGTGMSRPWWALGVVWRLRFALYPLAWLTRALSAKPGRRWKNGLVDVLLPEPDRFPMSAIIGIAARIRLYAVFYELVWGPRQRAWWEQKRADWVAFWSSVRHVWDETWLGLGERVIDVLARVLTNRRPAVRRLGRGWAAGAYSALQKGSMGYRLGPRKGGDRLMVAGPWLGDLWTELFVWIPFLEWVKRSLALSDEEFLAVSRGGMGSWYRSVCRRYIDVFELLEPSPLGREIERLRRSGGAYWQAWKSPIEGEIAARLKQAHKSRPLEFLPPRAMFRTFRTLLENEKSRPLAPLLLRSMAERRDVRRPPTPDVPAGLPSVYVAVRLSFCDIFPDTPENRRIAAEVVRSVASRTDVVLLESTEEGEGTNNVGEDVVGRVHRLDPDPATALGRRAAVVAGAAAFVGTYGGFAHLATLHGVPSIGLYSERGRLSACDAEFRQSVAAERGLAPVMLADATRGDRSWLESLGRARTSAERVVA